MVRCKVISELIEADLIKYTVKFIKLRRIYFRIQNLVHPSSGMDREEALRLCKRRDLAFDMEMEYLMKMDICVKRLETITKNLRRKQRLKAKYGGKQRK